MISRVSFTAVVAGTVETFDRDGFRSSLAASLRRGGAAVEASMVELIVEAASVQVTSIINDPPDVSQVLATLAPITASAAALSTALGGVPIASIATPPSVETLAANKPPSSPPSSPPPTPPLLPPPPSPPPPPWYATVPSPPTAADPVPSPPAAAGVAVDDGSVAAQTADANEGGIPPAGVAGIVIGSIVVVLLVLGACAYSGMHGRLSFRTDMDGKAVDVEEDWRNVEDHMSAVSSTAAEAGGRTSSIGEDDAAADVTKESTEEESKPEPAEYAPPYPENPHLEGEERI